MALGEKQTLIKSRKRVRDHGEVFTPEWLVRDMCDLVAGACLRVGSRFLEPACGDGNFLAEILRRKLAAARQVAGGRGDSLVFRREAFRALTSLYGVDILPDNVFACRARLLALWGRHLGPRLRNRADAARCHTAARCVLARNIVLGDTLHPAGTETHAPIVFTEWQWAPLRLDAQGRPAPDACAVIATDFTLAELLDPPTDTLAFAESARNTRAAQRYWEIGLDFFADALALGVPVAFPPAPDAPTPPPRAVELRGPREIQPLLAL